MKTLQTLAAILTFVCPGVALADTLTASTGSPGPYSETTGGKHLAQTFTIEHTGTLTHIELFLGRDTTTHPLEIELFSVVDGAPATSLGLARSFAPSEISTSRQAVLVDVANVDVTAGTQIAVVLRSSGPYSWGLTSAAYGGGSSFYDVGAGWTTWASNPTDFVLTVTTQTGSPPPPPVPTLAELIAALDVTAEMTHKHAHVNDNRKNALLDRTVAIDSFLATCDIRSALEELGSIRKKADGGSDDWIVSGTAAAAAIRARIDAIAAEVRAADCDGDGASNDAELAAGTDPGDPASH